MKLRLGHISKRKLLWLFLLPDLFVILLLVLNAAYPLPAEKTFSHIVLARDSSLLSAYLTKDDKWRMETNIRDVSPDLVKAILAKEDKYFLYHPGVNPIAIIRAVFSNLISGKRTSGASTITMQLARLMEPHRRTYFNKFTEMFRALQLEWYYPKRRILELYMSYVPFGSNIEGIKAASLIYFGRSAKKLSLAQSVLLTVVPNRPNSLRLDRFTDVAIKSRDKWLLRFQKEKLFEASYLKEAIQEPVLAKRHELTSRAPHFSLFIKDNYKLNEAYTTLDPGLQRKAESALNTYVERTRLKNVTNGAVIIIDNKTMEVLAYCGSADFKDVANSGQVNGIRAFRSPGSALKPALYTLAMDKGLITPKSQMLDIPTNFNGYIPEDYDQKFRGAVTAEYALVQSLNIPAIRLLHDYGMNPFIDFLSRTADFRKIRERRNDFGLSIILGACGVTLEEMAHSYSAFANEGIMKPLHYRMNEPNMNGVRLYSPEASWLTMDILSQNFRPDIPSYFIDQSELPKIAWKTGTAYGKTDAWAIGVNPRYTIGVWMGNFNGSGAPELSGAEMAVPLLFDLFNRVDSKNRKEWFKKPDGVLSRKVCKESGMPAKEDCELTSDDFYIKNISAKLPCNLYREFFVDEKESIQYCMACLPANGFKRKKYPMYMPELALWYKENGTGFSMPPPHNPDCQAKIVSDGPNILSPSSAFEYYIDEDAPQQMVMQAASGTGIREHYWYIDDKFIQKAKSGEKVFFNPRPGKHKISCMDDRGQTSSIMVKITRL